MTAKYFCDGCGKEAERLFELTIEGFLAHVNVKYGVCVECKTKLTERFESMKMKIKGERE